MRILNSNELDASVLDWPVHMQRALDLAANVLTAAPNPRVGCVITRQQQVLGEGWHEAAGHPHAEAMALQSAGAGSKGGVAFVSLEPCDHLGRTAACTQALMDSGISQVVIAMVDPNPKVSGKGIKTLESAGIEVIQLVDFEQQARAINPGFVKRWETGRPLVRMKLAMSLDGRTALASGESKWITSEAARADVQRLRAISGAIITGVGTVLADDPSLSVRTDELDLSETQLLSNAACLQRQPVRVVLDSELRAPATARVFEQPGAAVVFTNSSTGGDDNSHPDNVDIRNPGKCGVEGESALDLVSVVECLASDYDCNEVLVEAGPTLCGSFLRAGLIDELVVYIAPRIFGSDARPLFDITGLESLASSYDFSISEIVQVGADIKAILNPVP